MEVYTSMEEIVNQVMEGIDTIAMYCNLHDKDCGQCVFRNSKGWCKFWAFDELPEDWGKWVRNKIEMGETEDDKRFIP